MTEKKQETAALAVTGIEEAAGLPATQDRPNVFQVAKWLAKSQLIPKALQDKPADVAVVLMWGRELAISDIQAVDSLDVIHQGRVSLSAELQRALVRKSGVCEYLYKRHGDDKSCTWVTRRKGDPQDQEVTWNLNDAKRAGLLGKDNWRNYTPAMLSARASSALCREVYPDVLKGLVYTSEELRDMEPEKEPEKAKTTTEKVESLQKKLAAATAALEETRQQAGIIVTDEGDTVDEATGEIVEEGPEGGFEDLEEGPEGGEDFEEEPESPGNGPGEAQDASEGEDMGFVTGKRLRDLQKAATRLSSDALLDVLERCKADTIDTIPDALYEKAYKLMHEGAGR